MKRRPPTQYWSWNLRYRCQELNLQYSFAAESKAHMQKAVMQCIVQLLEDMDS